MALVEKKPNLSETISKIGKDVITTLKIDDMVDWARNQMQRLGILEDYDTAIYYNSWAAFRFIFKALWGYKVVGKSNFPEYGPVIVVANHQSELDPFITGSAVQRKVQWVSKKENFDIPLFKSIIKPYGTIALKRGESDTEAMAKIKAILANGDIIGIFPEGTRSETGELGAFHKGAARLCLETGVPYVPIATKGANKIMPKGKRIWEIKLNAKIEVHIGKAVYPEAGMTASPENAQILADQMFRDVKALLESEEPVFSKHGAKRTFPKALNAYPKQDVSQDLSIS